MSGEVVPTVLVGGAREVCTIYPGTIYPKWVCPSHYNEPWDKLGACSWGGGDLGSRNGRLQVGWGIGRVRRCTSTNRNVRRCVSANGNIRRCANTNVNLRRRASASGNSPCAAASFLSPVARHSNRGDSISGLIGTLSFVRQDVVVYPEGVHPIHRDGGFWVTIFENMGSPQTWCVRLYDLL